MKPLLLRNQGPIQRTKQRQTTRRRTTGQTKARQPKFRLSEEFSIKDARGVHYTTGNREAAARYGRQFIEPFKKIKLKGKKRRIYSIERRQFSELESVNSIMLFMGADPGALPSKILCGAAIGFGKKIVVIESLHGSREKVQPELERFRETYGKPWANFLIRTVEEHARKNGFEWAVIRHPKSLYYYRHPAVRTRREVREVRRRMLALYRNAAEAMGYERQGSFFVKKLN